MQLYLLFCECLVKNSAVWNLSENSGVGVFFESKNGQTHKPKKICVIKRGGGERKLV